MEALSREKVLQKVETPLLKDLLPQAVMKHREAGGKLADVLRRPTTPTRSRRRTSRRRMRISSIPSGRASRHRGRGLGLARHGRTWARRRASSCSRRSSPRTGSSVRKGHTPLDAAGGVGRGAVRAHRLRIQGRAARSNRRADRIGRRCRRPWRASTARGLPPTCSAWTPPSFLDFYAVGRAEDPGVAGLHSLERQVKGLLRGMQVTFTDSAQMLNEGEKWQKIYKEIFRSGGGEPFRGGLRPSRTDTRQEDEKMAKEAVVEKELEAVVAAERGSPTSAGWRARGSTSSAAIRAQPAHGRAEAVGAA